MLKKNIGEYLEDKNLQRTKENYSMSIREIINMYTDGLINLSPIYQRKFRWDDLKASKLIESIFMGIPLPPIFISVRNGKWDIIDGVQRISSILWFVGKLKELKDGTKIIRTPLKLKGLEELELFNEKTINELKNEDLASFFKYFEIRRLDLVLLTSNDVESEYELFSRLNTGGITLSAQEIRNFLIVKLNPKLYDSLLEISIDENIDEILSISKKQKKEDYGMELLIYFLIISKAQTVFEKDKEKRLGLKIYEEYKSIYSLSRDRFIDVCISTILKEKIDIDYEIKVLTETLIDMKTKLKDKPFRKGTKFSPFLYICLCSYICNSKNKTLSYSEALLKIQNNEEYLKKSSRGTNVVEQFISGIKIGRDLLND